MCYDHHFSKLQTLLSLQCILRKFHVYCHNAIVNILITTIPIFLFYFPGDRIFIVSQTGRAVHIRTESVAVQPVLKR